MKYTAIERPSNINKSTAIISIEVRSNTIEIPQQDQRSTAATPKRYSSNTKRYSSNTKEVQQQYQQRYGSNIPRSTAAIPNRNTAEVQPKVKLKYGRSTADYSVAVGQPQHPCLPSTIPPIHPCYAYTFLPLSSPSPLLDLKRYI